MRYTLSVLPSKYMPPNPGTEVATSSNMSSKPLAARECVCGVLAYAGIVVLMRVRVSRSTVSVTTVVELFFIEFFPLRKGSVPRVFRIKEFRNMLAIHGYFLVDISKKEFA